jgi:hypothetical protein
MWANIKIWFDEMVLQNNWLSIHMLGGAIITKIGLAIHYTKLSTVLLIAVAALLWELVEWTSKNCPKAYGSCRRAVLDSTGDILGTVIIAILFVC